MITFIFNVSFIFLLLSHFLNAKGTVYLDSLVFDKIISKFKATLVKFDVAYPYGQKHENYITFAESAYGIDDLLIAEVGIKDYGDKDNEDLAQRFNVKKDDYPVVKLFVRGKNDPVTFNAPKEDDFTVDNLRRFVKRNNKDLYIGSPGCIQAFDDISKKFAMQKNIDRRKSLLLEAENVWDKTVGQQEQKLAEIYVKTMRKILEKGDEFVDNEKNRINKVLKGDLSKEKRMEFNNRLNILENFAMTHDEL